MNPGPAEPPAPLPETRRLGPHQKGALWCSSPTGWAKPGGMAGGWFRTCCVPLGSDTPSWGAGEPGSSEKEARVSSGSVGLEAWGPRGGAPVLPSAMPGYCLSPSSSGLCFLSSGGAREEGVHLLPPGGALSPGNLWAGQRQASLCLSTEPDPGSEVAGGRETAGEAGDVVWGQDGHQVQAGRGPMWGGVCFRHRSARASWCPVGSSGCGEGVPIPHPSPLLLCSQGLVGASLVLHPRPSLRSWGSLSFLPPPTWGSRGSVPEPCWGLSLCPGRQAPKPKKLEP